MTVVVLRKMIKFADWINFYSIKQGGQLGNPVGFLFKSPI